jgi:hypothetical protein
MNSDINVNNPYPNHNFQFKLQPNEHYADKFVRLLKDLLLFVVAIGFVSLVILICYDTLTSPSTGSEEKKWAMAIISGAASGVIGYLLK